MNEESIQEQPRKMTGTEIVVLAIAGMLFCAVVFLAALPTRSRFSERGNITKGISNARQIVMALKLYASDHDGKYPDAALENPQSANEVFRILFKEEIIDSEVVFGCPVSPFVPDGNIGTNEDRSKALERGENHWAMTRGVTDKDSGSIPLVFENPVKAAWPPMWNPDAKGTMTRGRAWPTGVIMGMNDGGALIHPLSSKRGTAVPLKKISTEPDVDLFEMVIDPVAFPEGKILDVDVGDL